MQSCTICVPDLGHLVNTVCYCLSSELFQFAIICIKQPLYTCIFFDKKTLYYSYNIDFPIFSLIVTLDYKGLLLLLAKVGDEDFLLGGQGLAVEFFTDFLPSIKGK